MVVAHVEVMQTWVFLLVVNLLDYRVSSACEEMVIEEVCFLNLCLYVVMSCIFFEVKHCPCVLVIFFQMNDLYVFLVILVVVSFLLAENHMGVDQETGNLFYLSFQVTYMPFPSLEKSLVFVGNLDTFLEVSHVFLERVGVL